MEDINIETCPDCDTTLFIISEKRDNGNSEEVAYCRGCGYVETINT